jgi:radical SAM protein with 4Fe4S-binding SPASM domain
MSSNFFDIRGIELLELCPTGVDQERWQDFRTAMQKSKNLEAQESGPIQIDLELNGSCNMQCPFCIHGYNGQTNLDLQLSLEQAKNILQQAYSAGAASLKLNYINEPLIRKDLEDVIAYARSVGYVNIYLVTNGSLLTPERQLSILQAGLTRIYVSIDAATAETYNKQRKSGLYERVVGNVRSLIQTRNSLNMSFPLVRVSFLKNAINIHEALDFFDQWKDTADLITFQTMNNVPDTETGLSIESFAEPKPCDFPFKQLVVDHEGNILPCCKLPGRKLKIGNIKSMSIQQAWQSDKMQDLRSQHSSENSTLNPICRACLTNE